MKDNKKNKLLREALVFDAYRMTTTLNISSSDSDTVIRCHLAKLQEIKDALEEALKLKQ